MKEKKVYLIDGDIEIPVKEIMACKETGDTLIIHCIDKIIQIDKKRYASYIITYIDENTSRIIEFGRKVWSLLTDDEKEGYACGYGTLAFIDHILYIMASTLENYKDLTPENYEIVEQCILSVKPLLILEVDNEI